MASRPMTSTLKQTITEAMRGGACCQGGAQREDCKETSAGLIQIADDADERREPHAGKVDAGRAHRVGVG